MPRAMSSDHNRFIDRRAIASMRALPTIGERHATEPVRRGPTDPTIAEPKIETLVERVNRAKARWLKRVMYESSATSTEKCFAYSVVDHLNCVTLDCWPSQIRFAQLLGFRSTKTPQRAARGLERLGVLTLKHNGRSRYRYAPVFLPGDADKIVPAGGQPRPPVPDSVVRESLLEIFPTSSSSMEAAGKTSERDWRPGPNYDPRQRGAMEIEVAAMLGNDGIEVLARLATVDNGIIDRLCRAYAAGALGERELAAARLAAE
jgi:hypothetical protein